MKKFGFTLAEVIVTVGIIAVAAAMLAPLYSDIRPDRYKTKVIRCYNQANEATERLLENPQLYYPTPSNPCYGLNCTSAPIQNNTTNTIQELNFSNAAANASGDCKYPILMAELLHLNGSCTSGKYAGTASDRTVWTFEIKKDSSNNIEGYTITVDLDNAANSNNCIYSANNCRNPDQFSFYVEASGDITAGDDLTRIYLNNMTNIHKKDDDAEL